MLLQSVAYQFGNQEKMLFDEIYLALGVRETIVVLGPSGAGKTTLLKLMAGLINPIHGKILFRGEEVARTNKKTSIELSKQIGMSFQMGGLLDTFSVGGNIDFALEQLTLLNRSERSEVVHSVLDQVGLAKVENCLLEELSGGMLKRLSLARAIALEPSILLLDEPTAGLDPVTSLEIVNLIKDFQGKKQASVVVVTSDLSVAFSMADRLVFLWNGKLIDVGTPAQALNSTYPAVNQFISGKSIGPLTADEYA